MKQLLFLLVITSAMLSAQTAGKRLVVELSVPRQTFALGDDISITAKVCNWGSEPLSIYRHLLWGYRGGLILEINDASGHKVEPEQLDEDSVIPSTLSDPKSFLEILPDYEWGVVRRDKIRNLFGKPGRYTVRLKYLSPVPKKYFAGGGEPWATEDGPVLSDPITVGVK